MTTKNSALWLETPWDTNDNLTSQDGILVTTSTGWVGQLKSTPHPEDYGKLAWCRDLRCRWQEVLSSSRIFGFSSFLFLIGSALIVDTSPHLRKRSNSSTKQLLLWFWWGSRWSWSKRQVPLVFLQLDVHGPSVETESHWLPMLNKWHTSWKSKGKCWSSNLQIDIGIIGIQYILEYECDIFMLPTEFLRPYLLFFAIRFLFDLYDEDWNLIKVQHWTELDWPSRSKNWKPESK